MKFIFRAKTIVTFANQKVEKKRRRKKKNKTLGQ
jgi:hypothetical protein